MMRRVIIGCAALLLAPGAVTGEEAPAKGAKVMSGMSVLGNDDAPKSLVIVPWKSSSIGDVLDVSRGLDDGRGPVDRDVFMRELDYYEIRAASHGSDGSVAR
jgi:hypothetical protein